MAKTYEELKKAKKRRVTRNEFVTAGKYNLPIIRNQNIDLSTIELLNICRVKIGDKSNNYRTVHFFTYDWLFDNAYDKPQDLFNKLEQYYALLSPDFSMFTSMPLALQIESTFKNRWCGAYWQTLGMKVIPTVQWSDERSFEFCFDGIEVGSVVAVGTNYIKYNKDRYMAGYNKMLEVIKPSAIICFGEPFRGMRGNIKVVSPFDHAELAEKLGADEYARRLFEGDVYPS